MAKDHTPRSSEDALAREIDRLLRKLPGADPTLKGDPEPAAARVPTARPGGAAGVAGGVSGPATPGTRPRVGVAAEPSLRARQAGVWVRTVLGAALGVAVAWWPYAAGCGWSLYLYMAVIAVVMLAGGWASVWAWRVRVAFAHVVALILVFWGVVLAAEQILPRLGYAAESATWSCRN
jgi:hypothetical protein